MNVLFISQLYPLSEDSKNSWTLHYFVKEWSKNDIMKKLLVKTIESPVLSITPVQGDAVRIIKEPNSGFNCDKHDTKSMSEVIITLYELFV